MNIPESNLRNMLSSISELNHVLNETLKLCKTEKSDCPDCGYDPIRGESTDPYCSTCDGEGQISTPTFYEIPSSIETMKDFRNEYENVGKLVEGEILATIDKQEIDGTLDPNQQFNMDDQMDIKRFVEQYDYFEWKGARYALNSFEPGYLQGHFYEVSVKLKLREG